MVSKNSRAHCILYTSKWLLDAAAQPILVPESFLLVSWVKKWRISTIWMKAPQKCPNHQIRTTCLLHKTWRYSCQENISSSRGIIGKQSYYKLFHGQVCHEYLPCRKTSQDTEFKTYCYPLHRSVEQGGHSHRIVVRKTNNETEITSMGVIKLLTPSSWDSRNKPQSSPIVYKKC